MQFMIYLALLLCKFSKAHNVTVHVLLYAKPFTPYRIHGLLNVVK